MSAALHYENLVVEYHNKSGVKRAVDQVSLVWSYSIFKE
jgi:hypothetical protein